MTSNADAAKSPLYYLVEDFVVGLLSGAAFVALQVALATSFTWTLIGGLLWPGLYFSGQRLRRSRSGKVLKNRESRAANNS